MPRKTTPTLSQALDEYMLIRSTTCAKNTVANDRALLRKFVREVGADKQVHTLTPQDVEVWFAIISGTQKATSFNKVRQRVQGFIKFVMGRQWLDIDPTSQVGTRTPRQQDRMRLTAAQMLDLIELTENPRDRGMLALACNTGLRAGDLSALQVKHVDLTQAELAVHVEKTGQIDYLPITVELDVELRRYLSWYADRLARTGQAITSDAYLFPALGACNSVRHRRQILLYGDPIPSKRQTHPARVVQRALNRIGIEDTTFQGFHTIRRSVGRLMFDNLAEDGQDNALRLTASLLGHKNVATTELYLGIDKDREKRNEYLKGRSLLGKPAATDIPPLRQVGT